MPFSLRRIATLGLMALVHQSCVAQAMSFDAAWQRLKARSAQLASAQAGVQNKEMLASGVRALGGPVIDVFATSLVYNANLAVDLSAVNQKLTQIEQHLPSQVQQLLGSLPMPTLPANYTFNKNASVTTGSIAAIWPIYMGGLADATRALVSAQASEARADADKTEHELATLLVARYFGVQLANQAARLRGLAQNNIAGHDAASDKMLTAGVISKIERLQTQVAFEEAKRNTQKAQDHAALASTALAHTLRADEAVVPKTPLFVLSQTIEPLPHFLAAAQLHHPGLTKIAAKKAQAEQLHAGQQAMTAPQLFAFGQRELKTGNADWMAGIGARWNLFDSIDHKAMTAASDQMIVQAEQADAQARNDIGLLVEKHWRNVEQQRLNFIGMQPTLLLAGELLRLRTAALREGTGTALELIDADVNLAKVQTERAQVAFDYVLALAQLLESCGLSEQFGAYIARADITLD